jgi:GAF domain-containing protein
MRLFVSHRRSFTNNTKPSSPTSTESTSPSTSSSTSTIASQIQTHIQQHYNGNTMKFIQDLDPEQQKCLLQQITLSGTQQQQSKTTTVTTSSTISSNNSIAATTNGAAATTAVNIVSKTDTSQEPPPPQQQPQHEQPSNTSKNEPVPEPSQRDLRLVTFNMAVPFVGFGIMDNSLLILAGDMIDTSLGVVLGISTMCAAAIGNIISDIAGLLLGTFIEDFCANRLNLPVPNLSTAQRQLRSVRFASQWGCGIGVTIGCIIGMFPLLFIDSKRVQAKKREAHLDSMFRDVVTEAGSLVGAARTCLYLLVSPNDDSHTMKQSNVSLMPVADGKWLVNKYDDKASASKGDSSKERWIPLGRSIVSRAVLTGESLNIADVATEPDFVPDIGYVVEPTSSSKNTPVTRSMLCVPVMDSAGRPIAVIQAINKIGKGREDDDHQNSIVPRDAATLRSNEPRTFTENDVQILKALASHISVSLQRMYEQAGGDEAEMRLKDTIHMLKKYGLAGLDEDHNQHQQYKPSTNRNAKAIRRPLFPDDDDG